MPFIISENLNRMPNGIQVFLALVLALVPLCQSITAVAPVWIASSYFKAGAFTFAFTGAVTTQNLTITYSSSMVNSTLKVPTLGITDLNYAITSQKIQLLVYAVTYSSTSLTTCVSVNSISNLKLLKFTYMALDNTFTPAFSMNYFIANLTNTAPPSVNYQTFVNFTYSTGVTLNTSHENVLLPFLHYVEGTTYDGTFEIKLSFYLVNGSFYSVNVSSSSNIYLSYVGFSRLIFDKTAIEAIGTDYFNYGVVDSLAINSSTLSTTIPPAIIPSNLYYGLHSFNIQTSLSQLNFISSYNVTSGFIGYTPQGTYTYKQMKFSYMHHKTRTCPSTNPYYNISEILCYDQCAVGWYPDYSTMMCKQCLYDCLTCTNSSACTTCDATTDFRQLSSSRCAALPGYYDDGSSSPIAKPCTSPCATCASTATNCQSCVSGYYLSASKCYSCSAAIPSCNTCSNSTYCTLCSNGTSGTTCTTCTSNQFMNTTSNTCVSCSSSITNCLSCASATQCTLCKSTFTLYSSTNCSCAASEYLASGQCNACSSAVSYCATCSNANTCLTCASTFTLFSATNCACNSSTYLNSTTSQCKACTTLSPYCTSCTSSGCTTCMSNFTVSSGTCTCVAGYYPNSTSNNCQTCSTIANCLTCTNASNCKTCGTGFKANATTGVCDVQLCTVPNCDTCVGVTTNVCKSCGLGYSVGADGSCRAFCGNGALDTSQVCDDANQISGDGCSSSCQVQTGFSCYNQDINSTNTYSWCFYTDNITFTQVWIRKFEGNNSLKFEFQLMQAINQWATVNFTEILNIDQYDPTTNMSLGLTSSIISSFSAGYQPDKNRFWVIMNYINASMQKNYLVFSLSPYDHHSYPAFTPPNNLEFNPPVIQLLTTVLANNNQNANLYTDQQYGLYSVSVCVTYFIVGLALFAILTSVVFRTGKLIVFEMITIMQITYFSIAFLDSMSPVFSGILPLRFLAGILTFQNVESYLQELTSPNSMKGIYMYLHLGQNLSWLALGLICFLGLGLLLIFIYFIYDHFANPETLSQQVIPQQDRNGYCLHRLAFHFIGELSLSLIFLCLPIYTISLFFEILFTQGSFNFWSYAEALGIGLAIFGYFIALLKADVPKDGYVCRLGEYVSEFNCLGCFQIFKYCNFQVIQTLGISGLVMLTIYSNSKIYSTLCIVLTAVVDIVIVSIAKPYRYGFVSCFKGHHNDTESVFEKIELYKVYEKEPPPIIRIEQPDHTQKSEEHENHSELFTQHFAARINIIKSKHQGLVQGGEILNHTKLFLFNNNTRRIINLTTLIVVEFVFVVAQIYAVEVSRSYPQVTVQNMLPLLIHIMLTFNVSYNYTMLVLQILDRRKENLAKVDIEPESPTVQLNKSVYTQATKDNAKQPSIQPSQVMNYINTHDMYQTNQLIIKSNARAPSVYDHKRPHIVRSMAKSNRQNRKKETLEIVEF